MSDRHKKIVSVCALLLMIAFMVFIGIFVGRPMVRMAENPEEFRAWVDASGIWGRVLFVGMVILQVVIAFIPGEPVEIAAGYVFGFWEGSILTMAGFLLGSWLVFALVRKIGMKLVEVFFSPEKILEFSFLKNSKKTTTLAFLLMLIPGTPKDFISYFAGLTKMSAFQWLSIVAIARIPSLVTSTITGAAAGEERYVLSVILLCVTIFIAILGILYYRRLCKLEQEETV